MEVNMLLSEIVARVRDESINDTLDYLSGALSEWYHV